MIYRVLVFLVCLHITRACLPMQPAEDMPCPTPPIAAGAPPFVTSGLGQPMNQNGNIVYKCTPPEKLIVVEAGKAPEVLADDETLTCKPNSAIFVTKDDKAVGSKTYTCGGIACAVCPLTQLFDKDAAACKANPMVICKSKPIWMIDPADMCQKIMQCAGAGETLNLITSTTSVPVDITKLKCDKQWQADGATPIPAEAGFACITPVGCGSCTTAVNKIHDMAPPLENDPLVPIKPSCRYKCPVGSDLTYNNVVHPAVFCDMDTESVTLDSPMGMPLMAPNDKLTCASCLCTNVALNEGDINRCPKGTVCTLPSYESSCEATCAGKSVAAYLEGEVLMTSPTIRCVSGTNKWIGADVDQGAGITCQTKGDDLSSTPPTGGAQCPLLGVYTCPNAIQCDASFLVYVQDTDGYTVMCKKGSLITDKDDASATAKCSDNNMWSSDSTMASCIQDDWPVLLCVDKITNGDTIIDYSCELGICYLFCMDPAKQLQYGVSATIP